ncbi:hypothetical protein D9M70_572720 [compost metagenome]
MPLFELGDIGHHLVLAQGELHYPQRLHLTSDVLVWAQGMPVAQVGFGNVCKDRVHQLMRRWRFAVVQIAVFKIGEANA